MLNGLSLKTIFMIYWNCDLQNFDKFEKFSLVFLGLVSKS